MIISASYRTDIPAFFGTWFAEQMRQGYSIVKNPYGGPSFRVLLRAEDIDGFVFWTKNIGPFLPQLARVHDMGLGFYIQHTINAYPRFLEPNVPPASTVIEQVAQVTALYGHRSVVWRYDPIVFTSQTPFAFHVENFARLACQLRGLTDEVVISFMQSYQKTRRNLAKVALEHGIAWWDPDFATKQRLIVDLLHRARENGMRLSVCSQPECLVLGAFAAQCADPDRLSHQAGRRVSAPRQPKRKHCGCCQTRDIGAYHTCRHGCAYCYAVSRHPQTP